MYELRQVGENTFYIDYPVKIGVYRTDAASVYLVDSGNDVYAGKKIKKILDANGWQLRGVVNTHSHADHTGGNRYLQQQTGCRIFANGTEAAFLENPILEPALLYGGYPCKDLRHKFLLAEPSEATPISDEAFPQTLETIPLPGHCFDMIGVRTPDDVVFLADSLCSEKTLEKYGVTFIYDVAAYLDTLDRIEAMQAATFVPAHAEATEQIGDLVRRNRDKVLAIADHILRLLREPMCFERLLQRIFADYSLTMTFEQYALVGSTVRSYLAWLKDAGKVRAECRDYLMLWSCAPDAP